MRWRGSARPGGGQRRDDDGLSAQVGAVSGRRSYCAIKPPSITNSVPVTNEASSEARNNTP
jgi:hypothetical protein